MVFDFTKQFGNKKGANMSTIGIVILFILGLGGGGVGGYLLAPKTINHITIVETTQIQTQTQGQVTATVIGDKFTTNVQIEIESLTNIRVYQIINGKTNQEPDTNLPGWLPIYK